MPTIEPGLYFIRSGDDKTSISCPFGSNEEALELRMAPSSESAKEQQWLVEYDPPSDTYTFRNLVSGNYISAHYQQHKTKIPQADLLGFPISSGKAHRFAVPKQTGCAYSINAPLFNLFISRRGTGKNSLKYVLMDNGTQTVGVDGASQILTVSQLWNFTRVSSDNANAAVQPTMEPSNTFLPFFPDAMTLKTGVYVLPTVKHPNMNLGASSSSIEGGAITAFPADITDPSQQWEVTVYPSSLTATFRHRASSLYLTAPHFDFKPPYTPDDNRVPITLSKLARHWSLFKENVGFTINFPGTRWMIQGNNPTTWTIYVHPSASVPLECGFYPARLADSPAAKPVIDQGIYVIGSAQRPLIITSNGSSNPRANTRANPNDANANKAQQWTLVGAGNRMSLRSVRDDFFLFPDIGGEDLELLNRKYVGTWLLDPVPSSVSHPDGTSVPAKQDEKRFFIFNQDRTLALALADTTSANNVAIKAVEFTGAAEQQWAFELIQASASASTRL